MPFGHQAVVDNRCRRIQISGLLQTYVALGSYSLFPQPLIHKTTYSHLSQIATEGETNFSLKLPKSTACFEKHLLLA